MRRTARYAVAGLAFLISLGTAEAATLYVSTTGNDANSGAISSPLRTITRASYIARPGDTVHVRGGVYYEIVKILAKGTSSARIVFQSYPGERAIIDGTGSASGTNLVQISGAEYVDFADFEVRNSTRIGITGWGGRHVRVLRNSVHRSVKGGIWFGYSSFGATSDITIEGNRVYNNVLENQYHTSGSGWSQAIVASRTERVAVNANVVYNNDGEGIVFLLSDYGSARGNTVYDNYSVGIYLDNARYSTVDGNFIYSSGNSRYYRSSQPASGIGMANESYSNSNPLRDNRIINNIIVNSRLGIFYGNYENGGGIHNTTIANNTAYGATQALLNIDAAAHSGSFVQNNIFFASGGERGGVAAGSGITYRNNNWYGAPAETAAGSGDFIGDPRLVRAGGLAAADYKLTSYSPVLGRGVALTVVPTDYWRAARSSQFDIGAHQLSGGTSSADSQAPSAPPNLTASVGGTSSISLSWGSSTDNVGISGYEVFRNSAKIATVSGTSWTDQSLPAGTTYSYQVRAFDAASNFSAFSNSVSATTATATSSKVRVSNIGINYSRQGNNHNYQPYVTVVDGSGKVVSGATVTGSWSGALSGSVSATTQSNGTAMFGKSGTKSSAPVTFTVTSISAGGATYDRTLNSETSVTTSLSSVQ